MIDLLPVDLGLPARFATFYPSQVKVAMALVDTNKRFSFIDAPTGTGKSLIYMALAKLTGARVLILVGTKGLQQQLMADFEAAGMVDIRGQSNYRCVALDGELSEYGMPGSTCDQGPCKVGVFCPLRKGGCSYYDQQSVAKVSEIVVSNYAYWLNLGRHSEPDAIGEFDLLILDEAHTAPDWLTDFCAVDLDASEVRQLLGLSLPPVNEGVEIWSDWAKEAAKVARREYIQERNNLESGRNRRKHLRNMLRLSDLSFGLGELGRAADWRRTETPHRGVVMPGVQTDWVAEETGHGVKFSPVWAHAYAEQFLYRGIKRVILSSATLPTQIPRYMGIAPGRFDWNTVDSGFDPRRCPFIYIPTTRVDRNMVSGQVSQWVNRIDQIIDDRIDRKGIIHTRSYARAQDILSRSRHRDLMLTHSSRETRETIARFKHSRKPVILVSPSVEEGFDFPDDQCRYQIISKVPFDDGRNPVARERRRSDKSYPNFAASLSLTQMAGRGMRSRKDWCETFIIDDHWQWFQRAGKFPKWFKRTWKRYDQPPRPLHFAA